MFYLTFLLQEEDYKELGLETVKKAYEYLESTDWKVEKITSSEDVIQSSVKPIGKIYKLTGKVNYPAKLLLHDLFYGIENVPKWNPTLLESKIIKVSPLESLIAKYQKIIAKYFTENRSADRYFV